MRERADDLLDCLISSPKPLDRILKFMHVTPRNPFSF